MRLCRTHALMTAALLIALCPARAQAEQAPGAKTYTCPLLSQPPELDGAIEDDPAWKDTSGATGFLNLRTGMPADKPATVRMGYTVEALFLAIHCVDPVPDAILAGLPDGEDFDDEDSVSLFLSPWRGGLLHFAVNAIGSRASSRTLRKWQARAEIGDDGWTAEIALPWEVLGEPPAGDTPWRVNVLRYCPGEQAVDRATWANLEYSWRDTSRYVALRFGDMTPDREAAISERIEAHALKEEILVYSRPRLGTYIQSEFSERRILYNQARYVAPRISRDGERILINSVEGGALGVWVAERSGTDKTRICDGGQAAWAPDGARLVCVREGRLVEHDLESGQETVLTSVDTPRVAYPSYLPEDNAAGPGFRLVCADEAGERVYLVAPGADTPFEEVYAGEIRGRVECSPDGETLAFTDGNHIAVLDLASRTAHRLTIEPGVQMSPVWAEDGASICYAGAPSPLSVGWDIRRVTMDDPATVHVIETNVYPGFDWHGISVDPARTVEAPGMALATHEGDGVTVENEWLSLRVAGQQIVLSPKKDGQKPVALSIADKTGRAAPLKGVSLSGASPDNKTVHVECTNADGGPVDVRFTLSRARPLVSVTSFPEDLLLTLRAPMELLVVPDRLANDVLVTPNDVPSSLRTALPQAPVVLGCTAEPRALLAIALADPKAGVTVSRSAPDGPLDGLTAPIMSGVGLGLLPGESMWQDIDVNGSSGEWTTNWQPPFHAEWRVTAQEGAVTSARTWGPDEINGLAGEDIPIEGEFPRPPSVALAYALDRNVLTPLATVVPGDLWTEVWGVEAAVEQIDVKGVRGYRTATVDVPYRELTLYPPSWDPAKAVIKPGEYGVLEVMGSVFPVDSDGVRSLLDHLGADALNILRGLDDRIAQYETAMDAVLEQAQGQGPIQDMATEAAGLKGVVAEAPRTEMLVAENAFEAVMATVGVRDDITLDMLLAFANMPGNEEWKFRMEEFMFFLAAREGRVWHDDKIRFELWYMDEFKAFAYECRGILAERQDIIEKCRTWAKRTCDAAAYMAIADPRLKPRADEIRAAMHDVLRNRYYLEGDWGGEDPLPREAVQ